MTALGNNTLEHWDITAYGFSHAQNSTSFEIAAHSHLSLEIFICLSGQVKYVVEGKTYQPQYGDIILVYYDDTHHVQVQDDSVYDRVVINLFPEFMKAHSTKNELDECFYKASRQKHHLLRPNAEEFDAIVKLIVQIKQELQGQFFASPLMVRNYLLSIVVLLNRCGGTAGQTADDRKIIYNEKIDKVVQYINENHTKELPLDALSRQFYISKYHLATEFKKYTGFSIHNFITKKRLTTAQILLNKSMRLQDIVYACGFNDYSNFMRTFKREFGITPTEYRNRDKESSISPQEFP